jgi:D-glycero-alpha-D-manno-heptose 1-phosphate guanylyltransferase
MSVSVLPTSAIVLAGGLGTRLRSAVPDLPKPMAPVAGLPFLAHLLDQWMAQGVRHFMLSVGYRHEAIRSYFGNAWRGATIAYSVEETPLGTGGGLLLAAHHLAADAPFLVLNGDTWFDVDLAALAAFAARAEADWCLALFRTREPGRYMGVNVAADGAITDLNAGVRETERLANGGVYLIRPEALRKHSPGGAPRSLENDLFPGFIAEGQRFFGLECPGAFIDIGVPDDYRRAAAVLPTHPQEFIANALHH